MRGPLLASVLLAVSPVLPCTIAEGVAQSPAVGDFQQHADIGNPKVKGSAAFDASTQRYTLTGGGYNVWFNRDEFHYAYSRLKGDFILTANVKLMGGGKDPHRKIGWMVRAGEQDDAAHVSAVVHGDGLTVLQWRRLRGAWIRDPQDELFAVKKGAQIVQLERSGSTFIMRTANPGEPLQEVGRTDVVDMPAEALAGLFLTSHNADVQEEGVAWNVRIERTVPDPYNQARDGILGSRLELLNVADGTRRIIHTDTGRFEAPNWMPDGSRLLFNQGGAIYTIPVNGGIPEMLNTGVANHNNNDHVISFDGKRLGISSQRNGMPGGGSTVYVLPIGGGEPTLVTDSTPSYLHGWSPDGQSLVFTGQRNGEFDIYRVPAAGGPEVRLTSAPGLDDGPEYTPDGRYIYFNSNRTGTMQVWRMQADGSRQEAVTTGDFQDWFPHISPDGKWIVFLSFLKEEVPAGDHPFYKHVYLRLLPVAGGQPRVIAYLYGGQGSINTPSWSPDSKRLAFVSNTAVLISP